MKPSALLLAALLLPPAVAQSAGPTLTLEIAEPLVSLLAGEAAEVAARVVYRAAPHDYTATSGIRISYAAEPDAAWLLARTDPESDVIRPPLVPAGVATEVVKEFGLRVAIRPDAEGETASVRLSVATEATTLQAGAGTEAEVVVQLRRPAPPPENAPLPDAEADGTGALPEPQETPGPAPLAPQAARAAAPGPSPLPLLLFAAAGAGIGWILERRAGARPPSL